MRKENCKLLQRCKKQKTSGAKPAVGAGKVTLQNNPENRERHYDPARINCQLIHRRIQNTRHNRDMATEIKVELYHLFRYVSEGDQRKQKDTKGGYLKGEIQ